MSKVSNQTLKGIKDTIELINENITEMRKTYQGEPSGSDNKNRTSEKKNKNSARTSQKRMK